MSKRTLLMGGAVALAVVVMALAWLAGAGSTSKPGQKDHVQPQSQTIDPNWDPGKFDPHATGQTGMKQMLQGAGKTQFTRRNEKGQLEVYRGDPITPLPGGWWQVGKPEFIDYLAKDRALRLTADSGKLFAPAEPRAGQLLGRVKIEYFDARDPNKKVDIASDSPDLRFRMLMQDVNFDRDLFRLETDGPFHMTGPDFDFVGEHLKLVYSDARRRIETLQVQKSKWLRIHPQAKQPKVTAASDEAPPPGTQPVSTQPATTQPHKPARPIQYYRAVFPLNVRITSPQVQVACEELELIFSLQNDEGGQSQMFQKLSNLSPGQSPLSSQMVTPQLLAAMLKTGGSPLNQAMAQLVAWSMTQVTDKDGSASGPSVRSFGDGSLEGAASYFKTQSLAPSSDQDIVITWDGPLAVEPIEPKVAMNGAQDVYVKMIGRPVQVTGEHGEIVKSATLSYLVSQQKLTLLGDGAYPVSLDSPQLGGVLQADNFTLDQIHGTGHVDGPGVLRASNPSAAVGTMSPDQALATSGQGRLPAGFSIGWKDALELTFYKRQNQPTATDHRAGRAPFKQNPVQITALKTASFQGQVTVAHPSFNVQSDQLNMVMGQPGQGKQSLQNINATGHVRVGVHGQSPSQLAHITCHDLAIELGMNALGKVEPQRLVATTDVNATTVQGTLKTPRLTAVLNPHDLLKSDSPSATKPQAHGPARVYVLAPENTTAEAPEKSYESGPLTAVSNSAFADLVLPPQWSRTAGDFSATTQPAPPSLLASPQRKERQPLKQLIAENPVDIQMHDPAMHIVASRLVTDFGPTETQIQLFGTQASPVSVERQGLTMSGQRLVFARNARTLHIPGAGTMTFLSQEPVKVASTSQPAMMLPAVASATKVTVTWTQAMHFDDRDATAQFLGDVQVRGAKSAESTLLNCEDLRLAFIRKNESSFGETTVSGGAVASSQPVEADKQAAMLQKIRQVRSVTARNHVVFEAQDQGSNPAGQRPDTRVRIVGELMTFEGATQQVQVIGPGTMLLEDYRKPKPPVHAVKSPGGDTPKTAVLPVAQAPRAMVGRGATAFRWEGSMLLDAAVNDMILEKNVQMIYAPIDDNQRFQLDCSHLVTDLQDTGGIGSVTSAGTPKIKAVFADENVRLLTGDKQITTDHLEYDGSQELVLLTADTGKYTTISDAKSLVPLTFHQVKWFLHNNRFEGIAPGRGVVPLIQDSRRK